MNLRSILALLLTSMLTSLDYAQFQINFQTPGQLLSLPEILRTSGMHLKYLDMSRR